MNDTRLWPIKDDVEAALRGIRKITDQRIASPRDSDNAYALMNHLKVAHRHLVELMHHDALCLNYSAVGSCCYRNNGHEGPHRSEWGSTWTDDSNAKAAAAISASMEGRRD